jgi:hypothetical protein
MNGEAIQKDLLIVFGRHEGVIGIILDVGRSKAQS